MRYLITFSYDGTRFSGYQKQVGKLTIQEEIEKVFGWLPATEGSSGIDR